MIANFIRYLQPINTKQMRINRLQSVLTVVYILLSLAVFSQDALFPIEEKGKFGYINKSGKVMIASQFDYAESFSEGMAAVSVGGKRGFVDQTGKVVIAAQYDKTTPFSEGLASGKKMESGVILTSRGKW